RNRIFPDNPPPGGESDGRGGKKSRIPVTRWSSYRLMARTTPESQSTRTRRHRPMRRIRFASLAASGVALLLTTAAVAPAGAASTGVGTSQASTSILDVVLGGTSNALNLNPLSDK